MTALERENILPPLNRDGIGGNNPPSPIEIIRAGLAEAHVDIVARSRALAEMADRLPNSCDDADTAAKLTEAIKSCTAFVSSAEAARKAAKQPHIEAGKVVDTFFANFSLPVDAVKIRMGALLTAYQRKQEEIERKRLEAIAAEERRLAREAEAAAREAERVAREAAQAEARRQAEARAIIERQQGEARRKAEAEEAARREAERARLAAEQAEADRAREAARAARVEAAEAKDAANAPAAELTRARSDLGAVGSLRTTWHYEVTDEAAVPREYLTVDHAKIKAAMKVATKGGKCTLKVPGIRVYSETNTVVR